jgi:hypothetical protein
MSVRAPSIAFAMLLFLWSGTAAAERTAVLITNEQCPVSDLSKLQIRKAYLGILVTAGDYEIRPLRLTADEDLNRVFLQNIVAMSEKSYQRRALSLAVKFGTPRPDEFSSLEQAVEAMRKTTCSVIFLWASTAAAIDESKVVTVLWRGD